MRARILFLCGETISPNGTYASVEQFFGDILPGRGYDHIWIAPSSQARRVEKLRLYGTDVWVYPKRRPASSVQLLREYLLTYRDIVSMTSKAVRQDGPFDIILVRDDPLMALAAVKIRRASGIPVVYQMSHLKEEENLAYSRGGIYGSRLTNFMKGTAGRWLRNRLLRRADAVLPISERMKATLASFGVPASTMFVVPEGVDARITEESFATSAEQLRRGLGLKNKRVLLYLGTMNGFREPGFLLRLLRAVLREAPDAHLLMVGDSPHSEDLPSLKKKSDGLGLSAHVTFTGRVPREEVPAYICASEIGLSPFPPNSVLVNNSPIKVLEYLNMGRPVVASDIPEQKKIIEQSGGGYCVSHRETAFVEAILRLLRDPTRARVMGRRGQRYVREKRDFRVLASIIEDAYGNVLTPRRLKMTGYSGGTT